MALELRSIAKSPQGSKKLDGPREVSRDLLSEGPPQAPSLKVATSACSGPVAFSLQRCETQAVWVGRRDTLNLGQLILGSWVIFISVQLFSLTQFSTRGDFVPTPGHLMMSGDIISCHRWDRVLLASHVQGTGCC